MNPDQTGVVAAMAAIRHSNEMIAAMLDVPRLMREANHEKSMMNAGWQQALDEVEAHLVALADGDDAALVPFRQTGET